jgi:Metalloenzyme superfamily
MKKNIFLTNLSPYSTFIYILIIIIASQFVQAGAQAQSTAYQTRNVFIVAIDGIRNNEAFESGNLYIKYLWDSLRPQGTIYTNFRNSGVTVTNAGHSTIVTGVRQFLPNNSGIPTPVRPKEPTLAECYRKQLGIQQNKAYYISGKNTIWRYPISLYPGYGYAYAPTITLTSAQDTLTWDSTQVIMERDHPSLCYVLFAQVDAQGHTADTVKYLTAIRRVDSLIFLLWKKIQTDPVYSGKTTMIVTTDHGRHDDSHGGWQAHGDYCHGCRHIPFMAIGPDVKAGEEITLVRDQIDIAPTVANLLGFDMPFAQGSIMSEMLVSPKMTARVIKSQLMSFSHEINLSNSAGLSRSPALAINQSGLHAVYSDNTDGQYEVKYTRSNDNGKTWTVPLLLFSNLDGDDIEPDIASFGDSGLFVASSGYRYFDTESSYVWTLMGRKSANSGASWDSEFLIDTLGNFSCKPSISTSGNRISIVTMSAYRIMNFTSTDGGVTFKTVQVHGATSEMPSCTLVDTTCYAVWHHLNSSASPYWNVLWDDKPWQSGTDKFLTNNDSNSYSYDPSIAYDYSTTLHVVYAHLADASAGNSWTIRYSRDTNLDGLWSEPVEISGGRTCFSPICTVSDSNSAFVVWTDYNAEGWSVYGIHSINRGASWTAPYQITSTQPFIGEPDVQMSGDTMFVVWQDLRDGNWEVYFKKVVLNATASIKLVKGWNMVSLPVDLPDCRVSDIFPSAISDALTYYESYTVEDTLKSGTGYWIKFGNNENVNINGIACSEETINVREGWNMIGSIFEPLAVKNIGADPPGMIVSDFFSYGGGYQSEDTLGPGKGYWVKVGETGKLILSSSESKNTKCLIRIVPTSDLPPSQPKMLFQMHMK